MSAWRYSREEIVDILRREQEQDGLVSVDVVSLFLLDTPITDQDIAWAYQRARQHGWVSMELPTDRRYAQILAMDT